MTCPLNSCHSSKETSSRTKPSLRHFLILALTQSALLLIIAWPHSGWLHTGYTAWLNFRQHSGWLITWILAGGSLFLFADTAEQPVLRCSLLAIGYGATASLLWHYQAHNTYAQTLAAFCIYAIFCFTQHCHRRNFKAIHYHQLFNLVWNNAAAYMLSILFVLLSYGVLLLWAALFRAIGHTFFSDLFGSLRFNCIAMPMLFATGLYTVMCMGNVCKQCRQILLSFCRLLLPLLTFISILYLATTIMQWSSSVTSHSGLQDMLPVFALLSIIFINACYRTGDIAVHAFYRYTVLILSACMCALLAHALFANCATWLSEQVAQPEKISLIAVLLITLLYHVLYLFTKPKNITHHNYSLAWFAIIISASLCLLPKQPTKPPAAIAIPASQAPTAKS